MTRRLFHITKQIYPVINNREYRIVETIFTCDGMRSRLTNHVLDSKIEALLKLEMLEATYQTVELK